MKIKQVKKCDIWLADLSPVSGSEQGGKRPVVVISGNALNATLPISLCSPISSKIKEYPASLLLLPSKTNGLKVESEVIVFQTRTISHQRFIKKLGCISKDEHEKIFSYLHDLCFL